MRPVDSCQIYSSLSHPFFLDSIDSLTPFPSTGQFIFPIPLTSWHLSHPQVNSFSQFRWLPDTFPIHGAIHPLNFVDPLMPFPSTGQFIFPNSSGSSTTYFSQSPHTHRRTKRTSPLQTPWIPQSLRDLLRFARQMRSASADMFLMHLVASSRSVFM